MIKIILCTLLLLATSVFQTQAQIAGCTDPKSTNYNPLASANDGSCLYASASVSATTTVALSSVISETSGLSLWNGKIWTHNDNTEINIYALDTITGSISNNYILNGVQNIDWEEISQDENFFYVGDFGNNTYGNRQNLRILRVSKSSLTNNTPQIETINFSYSNQTDFSQKTNNNTDFDCESFIVSSDSIYLFSKQWIGKKTSCYSLPKIPGTYSAHLKSTYDVGGLITGATYLPEKKLIALCGYNLTNFTLDPFICVLYDFEENDFFGGNKRKIKISQPYNQVEGIATNNGLKYFISNEAFSKSIINIPQQLHTLDLSSFLSSYLTKFEQPTGIEKQKTNLFKFSPNPATNFVHLASAYDDSCSNFVITSQIGQIITSGEIHSTNQTIDISSLPSGAYVLKLYDKKGTSLSGILLKTAEFNTKK